MSLSFNLDQLRLEGREGGAVKISTQSNRCRLFLKVLQITHPFPRLAAFLKLEMLPPELSFPCIFGGNFSRRKLPDHGRQRRKHALFPGRAPGSNSFKFIVTRTGGRTHRWRWNQYEMRGGSHLQIRSFFLPWGYLIDANGYYGQTGWRSQKVLRLSMNMNITQLTEPGTGLHM